MTKNLGYYNYCFKVHIQFLEFLTSGTKSTRLYYRNGTYFFSNWNFKLFDHRKEELLKKESNSADWEKSIYVQMYTC